MHGKNQPCQSSDAASCEMAAANLRRAILGLKLSFKRPLGIGSGISSCTDLFRLELCLWLRHLIKISENVTEYSASSSVIGFSMSAKSSKKALRYRPASLP